MLFCLLQIYNLDYIALFILNRDQVRESLFSNVRDTHHGIQFYKTKEQAKFVLFTDKREIFSKISHLISKMITSFK